MVVTFTLKFNQFLEQYPDTTLLNFDIILNHHSTRRVGLLPLEVLNLVL